MLVPNLVLSPSQTQHQLKKKKKKKKKGENPQIKCKSLQATTQVSHVQDRFFNDNFFKLVIKFQPHLEEAMLHIRVQ